MKICVIGAGPSGLCAAKEIKENNPRATVAILEEASTIGGAFSRSYKGLTLVNNPLLISFSDFLAEECVDDLRMWTAEEYVGYLERYAKSNDLIDCIRCGSRVTNVSLLNSEWQVTFSNGHASHTQVFDYIVVCSGANGKPNPVTFKNQHRFLGRVVHSDDIKDPKELAGLNVVFVGMGESGSDLCYMSSEVSARSIVSIRRRPGYLIPRYHDGRPTDLDTSRIYHCLPKNIDESCLSFFLKYKRRIERNSICSREDVAIQDRADYLNGELFGADNLGPFRRTTTKSCGFIRAHLAGAVEIMPEIADLDGNQVHFSDGSVVHADIIVCCTGYKGRLEFLPAEIREHIPSSNELYEYMFLPDYIDKLAFVGFVRPGVGTVPVAAELQSRYLGLLLSGRIRFPSREAMVTDIRLQQESARRIFPADFDRVGHIIDYYSYISKVAKKIGVRPRQWALFFTDVRLWYKVNFSFLCPGMFRLSGPGAKPDTVKSVLRSLPTMPKRVLLLEGVLYVLCHVLAAIGLRRFRPLS
ncbi:flavin-containing monooxygenase [Burkholderia sp. S-53]|uniref:flavin-containing monooxygenase n=1 Tax=Burkholderia sp. S-53 TaxID=2906514 RepID=UPI0021D23F21|nr:NAD(P)-binding domain-containing protein [Burkholderia sp. S-53]UXU86536.1 NAD(P)-binding domain-containing protein [Burkholderia sp. S-53]